MLIAAVRQHDFKWPQLRHHPGQAALYRCRDKLVGVFAGRGSGKTEVARRKVVRSLPVLKPWPDPQYFYALPTYDQARRVAWRPLLQLIPKSWVKTVNNSELRVETVFGATLYVVGMDKPQRIEGTQWDGGVVDESCDQRPKSFALSVMPALTWRDGWCWRIGVPKRVGVGAREFKRFCMEDAHRTFHWSSEDILTPEQLAAAREALDSRDYNEQFRANWETVGGQAFHAFDEALDVRADVTYRPASTVIVGSDFNVDPMCWELCHAVEGAHGPELQVFDELSLRNTNTQMTLNALHSRYGQHEGGWQFVGDATARSRKTSASVSDYLLILQDQRFANKRVAYDKSNPRVHDRVAACNALLCNAAGWRRLSIHPRCARLVEDLKVRGYKPGTTELDDSHDVGHASDALGYVVYRYFPLRLLDPSRPSVVGID